MTTPKPDLADFSEADLIDTWDHLASRAARTASPFARDRMVGRQSLIADELWRRREELEAARERIAAYEPKPLPPRRHRPPRVTAIAGPGASHYLTP